MAMIRVWKGVGSAVVAMDGVLLRATASPTLVVLKTSHFRAGKPKVIAVTATAIYDASTPLTGASKPLYFPVLPPLTSTPCVPHRHLNSPPAAHFGA